MSSPTMQISVLHTPNILEWEKRSSKSSRELRAPVNFHQFGELEAGLTFRDRAWLSRQNEILLACPASACTQRPGRLRVVERHQAAARDSAVCGPASFDWRGREDRPCSRREDRGCTDHR